MKTYPGNSWDNRDDGMMLYLDVDDLTLTEGMQKQSFLEEVINQLS